MNVLRKLASLSRLIIREPSGALMSSVVSDVAGALIGRVLSDVGGIGTVGVGGTGFCFLGFFFVTYGCRWLRWFNLFLWFPI